VPRLRSQNITMMTTNKKEDQGPGKNVEENWGAEFI
jgi:hypothetical protein